MSEIVKEKNGVGVSGQLLSRMREKEMSWATILE